MAPFKLIEVKDKQSENIWLSFPSLLYKGDPNYVRPFDEDVKKLFDPAKNKLLRKGGDAIRWLLYDEQQQLVGRIAAFIDPNTAKNNDQPTGGCGFFDCINVQEAANQLFDDLKTMVA